jgi:thioredoxin reductase (NADPH)
MKFFFKLFILCLLIFFSNLMFGNEEIKIVDPRIIPIKTIQPEEEKIYPVAIIGAGAAGTMAVKRAVLNNNETLLFTGAIQEQRRSRGNWVRTVDNVPGLAKYTRTILELRNETLEELVKSPLKHNLYVIEDSVLSMEKHADYFKLIDGAGHIHYAQYVVLATGVMDEQPHIQGSIRPILKYANGQTVAYCLICDGHRSIGKKTVVIGHSESA